MTKRGSLTIGRGTTARHTSGLQAKILWDFVVETSTSILMSEIGLSAIEIPAVSLPKTVRPNLPEAMALEETALVEERIFSIHCHQLFSQRQVATT